MINSNAQFIIVALQKLIAKIIGHGMDDGAGLPHFPH